MADTEETVSALSVLLSLLDATQRKSYTEHGYFDFTSSSGRKMRLIAHDWQGNIWTLDEHEREESSYCAHIAVLSPWFGEQAWQALCGYYDPTRKEARAQHHLSQYLMLKTDDTKFFDIAL